MSLLLNWVKTGYLFKIYSCSLTSFWKDSWQWKCIEIKISCNCKICSAHFSCRQSLGSGCLRFLCKLGRLNAAIAFSLEKKSLYNFLRASTHGHRENSLPSLKKIMACNWRLIIFSTDLRVLIRMFSVHACSSKTKSAFLIIFILCVFRFKVHACWKPRKLF